MLYYPSPIPISYLKNKGLFHIDVLPDIIIVWRSGIQQLKNGFKFIKVISNYLYDRRSMNYSNFLEWLNLNYH